MLYKQLTRDMSLMFFVPYACGAVSGSVWGQATAMRFEKWIGASMDAHVKDASIKIVPARVVVLLGIGVMVFALLSGSPAYALFLAMLSMAQQISLTLVSRSRTRNNFLYHAIASVFSNGVWFLVFRQIEQKDWTLNLYAPYAAGAALGSISGAAISMGIERKLNIVSDK